MVHKRNNVTQRAMLVRLVISNWQAKKKDEQASHDVCEANNAEDDAASTWVRLAPKESFAAIGSARWAIKKIWLRYTLPWLDGESAQGGKRILPSKLFMKYNKEVTKAIDNFQNAVVDFVENIYPEVLEKSGLRLGKFLNRHQMPTVEQVKEKFNVLHKYEPFPDIADWRIDDADENVLDEVRDEMMKDFKDTTFTAVESLFKKIGDLVSKIQVTTGDKKAKFKDSLIGNLKDFVELLPDLNLTDDDRVEALRKECAALAAVKPQDLRDSKKDRKAAHLTAKEIMKKIHAAKGLK